MDYLKCPKCKDGHAGCDGNGEALDCHYCGGTGQITAEMFVSLADRLTEVAGEWARCEILLSDIGFSPESESVIETRHGEPMTIYTRNCNPKESAVGPSQPDDANSSRLLLVELSGIIGELVGMSWGLNWSQSSGPADRINVTLKQSESRAAAIIHELLAKITASEIAK